MSFKIEFPDAATISGILRALKDAVDIVRLFVGPDAMEIAELISDEHLYIHMKFDRDKATKYSFVPPPGGGTIMVAARPEHLLCVLHSAGANDKVCFAYMDPSDPNLAGLPKKLGVYRSNTLNTTDTFDGIINLSDIADTKLTLAPKEDMDHGFVFKTETFTSPIESLASLEKEFMSNTPITISVTQTHIIFSLESREGMFTSACIKLKTERDPVQLLDAPEHSKKRRRTEEKEDFSNALPATKANPQNTKQNFRISHLRQISKLFNSNNKNNAIVVIVDEVGPIMFSAVIGATIGTMKVVLNQYTENDIEQQDREERNK